MYVNKKIIIQKNLTNNINVCKKSNKEICLMVKANAYGHGIDNIVPMSKNEVDWFGVANVEEALRVLKLSPNSNVIVVGKTTCFEKLISNGISFTVDSLQELKLVSVKCKKLRKKAKLHIAINTGMNRIGVKTLGEFVEINNYIQKDENLILEGIFTHCYDADCTNNHFYEQMRVFYRYYKTVENKNLLVHIGGSYVLKNAVVPKFVNMVRVGFFAYGYGNKYLKPVMQIETQIVKIIDCSAGENVGYGKNILTGKKKIAVVPVGYADGVLRQLSNKFCFCVNNNQAQIVGNVCMDMCMIDVSNVNCKIGDRVTVMADAKKMAKGLNTSPYEILTLFQLFRGKSLIV